MPPGEPITTALSTMPPATEQQLEIERNTPTRTNSSTRHCGSPDPAGVEALPESTTAEQEKKAKAKAALAEGGESGHWHCHGEVYHRHKDWRTRHPSPHQTQPATGDRPAPALPYEAPTADDRAKGFTSGWHSHNEPGFNVYHRHGPGVHPH